MKTLFPELEDESWKEHWGGMPEYNQEDHSPNITVKVHFRNEDDLRDFEKIIGQRVTKYRVIWHPKAENRLVHNKIYANES